MVNGSHPYSQYSSSGAVALRGDRGARRVLSGSVSESAENGIGLREQPSHDQETTQTDGNSRDNVELSREAQKIRKLQLRDREVRAHEAAHAAVGGAYAGSPNYTFERGADGHSYAVGGSVSIDTSPVKGDPQATLQKAQQVRSAALAPAQPSAQDMKIAQKAQMMAAKARVELIQQHQSADASSASFLVAPSSENQKESGSNSQESSAVDLSSVVAGISRLDIYS